MVFQQSGYVLGETFAMVVLFNLTKEMQPSSSFFIASASLAVFGIIFTSLVIEH